MQFKSNNEIFDISTSTKCFKILVGRVFKCAGQIYDPRINDNTVIYSTLSDIGKLGNICRENYPSYEYNLAAYSTKCNMFDPNYSFLNDPYNFKDIVDCAHAMEPIRFEPMLSRQPEYILHSSYTSNFTEVTA